MLTSSTDNSMSKRRKAFSRFHFIIDISEFGMPVFFGQTNQLL